MNKKFRHEICELIRQQWFTDSTSKWILLMYLYHWLALGNKIFHTSNNEALLGILIGKISFMRTSDKLKYRILYIVSYIMSLFCATKADLFTIKKEFEIDKSFSNSSSDCNQILLFLVNKNYRGNGIGTSLLSAFEDAAENKNIRVYSDSFSDYEFYLKRGYHIAEEMHSNELGGEFYRLIK